MPKSREHPIRIVNEFSPEEITRRADAAIKRALMTPPKPFTPFAKKAKKKTGRPSGQS